MRNTRSEPNTIQGVFSLSSFERATKAVWLTLMQRVDYRQASSGSLHSWRPTAWLYKLCLHGCSWWMCVSPPGPHNHLLLYLNQRFDRHGSEFYAFNMRVHRCAACLMCVSNRMLGTCSICHPPAVLAARLVIIHHRGPRSAIASNY